MIDWWSLAANSLWIVACALALATFSYASWQASFFHEKLRVILERSNYRFLFQFAGVLFCAGLASTSQRLWEGALWAVLAVGLLVQLGVGLSKLRQAR